MNLALTISLCSEISEAQLLGEHLNGPLIPLTEGKASVSTSVSDSYRFTKC